jgi:hypothetical protein
MNHHKITPTSSRVSSTLASYRMTTPNNTLNRTPLTSRQRDASLLNDSSNTSRNSNNNNNNSNSKWNGKNGSLNNNNNNDDDDNNDDNERRRIYNDMPPLEADLPLSSSTSLLLLSSLPSIPLPLPSSSLLLSSFIPIIGHGGHHNVGSSVQLLRSRVVSSSPPRDPRRRPSPPDASPLLSTLSFPPSSLSPPPSILPTSSRIPSSLLEASISPTPVQSWSVAAHDVSSHNGSNQPSTMVTELPSNPVSLSPSMAQMSSRQHRQGRQQISHQRLHLNDNTTIQAHRLPLFWASPGSSAHRLAPVEQGRNYQPSIVTTSVAATIATQIPRTLPSTSSIEQLPWNNTSSWNDVDVYYSDLPDQLPSYHYWTPFESLTPHRDGTNTTEIKLSATTAANVTHTPTSSLTSSVTPVSTITNATRVTPIQLHVDAMPSIAHKRKDICITLRVTRIPLDFSNMVLQDLLTACGKLTKWERCHEEVHFIVTLWLMYTQ